jgi:phosphate transport system protein
MTQERRRHFHDALNHLQDRLLEMAGRAEEQVRKAGEALLNRNADLAKEVRKGDHAVDTLEQEVDEQVVELLALQQPMAVDLRRVVVTLKIANDLERVGDHAVNISKATKRMMEYPPLPYLPEVGEMLSIARGMLADCLAAYVARDPELARDVHARDDRVDNLRRSLYRILVSHMLEEPRRISPALEMLLVSQNIERIADLATNIAEDVVFLVEGKPMRDRTAE